MESLNILLTQKVNIALNVLEDFYSVALTKTNAAGVMRNINIPIELASDDGIFIQSLVDKAWNYIPDAAPDLLSQAKAKKLDSINNQWLALEKTGWDSGQGFSLGIIPDDVALLVGVFSLAKEATALGLPVPSIIAKDNSSIQFTTFAEMTTLMLRYGAARSEMAYAFAGKRRAVGMATTIEEVNAIT